jgi:hypothetical protein
MKIAATKYVSIRSGSPYITDNNKVGYYKTGDIIEVDYWVYGQKVEGNNLWYKLSNGNYVWSGATAGMIDTTEPDTDITTPTFDDLYTAVRKKYCIDKIPGVVGFGKGLKNGTDCIHLNVIDEDARKNIGDKYLVQLPGGNIMIVNTDIYITGRPKKHSAPPAPGWSIQNMTLKNGIGTFGCVVKSVDSADTFLLSCMHVLCSDYNYSNVDSMDRTIEDTSSGNQIGILWQGLRNNFIDAAIAQLMAPMDNANIGNPTGECIINDNSQLNSIVKLTGYDVATKTALTKTGVIANFGFTATLGYDDGNDWPLYDIISITNKVNGVNTSLTTPGYSGALVINSKDNSPIGIVVGGDSQFTYVIPIDIIFKTFNVKM